MTDDGFRIAGKGKLSTPSNKGRYPGRGFRKNCHFERQIVRYAHALDRGFQSRMLVPPGLLDVTDVAFTVVFRVNDNPIFLPAEWLHGDLDLRIRINADVENLAVLGEPGIRPAAIVADANRGHAVDNAIAIQIRGQVLVLATFASDWQSAPAPVTYV